MKLICITPFSKEDYLASCIIEGLKNLGVEIHHTDEGNGLVGCNSDEYILSQAKDADAIIAFWSKNMHPSPRYYLIDHLIHLPLPLAYVDGSEYNYTGGVQKNAPWLHPAMLKYADCYFKRECYKQDHDQYGIIPLPFAIRNKDLMPYFPKKYDVMCSFGQTKMDPIRHSLQDIVQDWKDSIGFKVPAQDFPFKLAQSRIGVNAHGGGEDCMRYWEILGAQTALFTQRIRIMIPNPLIDGKHCVEFNNTNEFQERVAYYLKNWDELQELMVNGYEHALKYHTTTARAAYMLDHMGFVDYGNS